VLCLCLNQVVEAVWFLDYAPGKAHSLWLVIGCAFVANCVLPTMLEVRFCFDGPAVAFLGLLKLATLEIYQVAGESCFAIRLE
jgi:hypothetical protein